MKNLNLILITAFAVLCLTSFNTSAADDSPTIKPTPLTPALKDSYFTIRPDFRRCVSPVCGGWFVNPVNLRAMKCLDGSIKQECYVGADKINIPGLSITQISELRQAMSESKALIRGNLSAVVDYGLLQINDAWLSASDQAPKGRFVSITDNGIRCITTPCPSYDAQILNRHLVKSLASYDLSAVEASDEQLAAAQAAVNSKDGLPMAGRFVEVMGPAGSAQGIAANQFYLKVESKEPKMCMPTGCSGQICADSNVNTTCEWRPEYACYRSASCSTQRNGDCGWVMDDELKRCLANSTIIRLLQPSVTK